MNIYKNFITPLKRYSKLSKNLEIDLWIKHDDEIPYAYGGGKARKLIRIFNDVNKENYNAIVTTGGIFSNHVRAAAMMAAEKGLKTKIFIHESKPQFMTTNLKIAYLVGADICFVKRKNLKQILDNETLDLKSLGYNPHCIHGGGHTYSGIKSFQDAASELANQCKKQKIKPKYLVVASGTGSTQAGLIAGSSKSLPNTEIIGISISHEKAKGLERIYESLDLIKFNPKDEINFYDDFLAGGYSKSNLEQEKTIRSAARTESLLLDPVYTAKAFFGLKQLIKSGKIKKGTEVIFWHTGSSIN